MFSSTPHHHTIERDIISRDDFEAYLKEKEILVANNTEIPAEELLTGARSDWKQDAQQGALILFWVKVITNEPDSSSPVGKKITPHPNEPTLHHFLDGMCGPVDFDGRKILRGQLLFAKNLTS